MYRETLETLRKMKTGGWRVRMDGVVNVSSHVEGHLLLPRTAYCPELEEPPFDTYEEAQEAQGLILSPGAEGFMSIHQTYIVPDTAVRKGEPVCSTL